MSDSLSIGKNSTDPLRGSPVEKGLLSRPLTGSGCSDTESVLSNSVVSVWIKTGGPVTSSCSWPHSQMSAHSCRASLRLPGPLFGFVSTVLHFVFLLKSTHWRYSRRTERLAASVCSVSPSVHVLFHHSQESSLVSNSTWGPILPAALIIWSYD